MSEIKNPNLYKYLINLGRAHKIKHAVTGAVIQLDGNTAYLLNEKRSTALRITSPTYLGTGCFGSSQALLDAVAVQQRESKTLFVLSEGFKQKYCFIPSEDPIKDICEKALQLYYDPATPTQGIDISSLLPDIEPSIIITTLSAEGNKVKVSQVRSDASVWFETTSNIGKGLVTVNLPPTGDVSVFTQDLTVLTGFVTPPVKVILKPNTPVSLYTTLQGAKVEGVISHLQYE